VSTELVDFAIKSAGGVKAWESRRDVAVRFWSGGAALASKWQGPVKGGVIRIATSGQRAVGEDFPEEGHTGVFERGGVRIEDSDGTTIAERRDARAAFSPLRSPRHLLWWDRLDMLYFAGYAFWTYLSVPFVLNRPGFELEELEPWEENGETWRPLKVMFPDDIHSHSKKQVLYFDSKDGLIRRHDYTAEPFGRWAKAAHYCTEHKEIGGLIVPTKRRVYPRGPAGRHLPGPLLLKLDLKAP
jgi:hypothetical protein